MVECQLRAGRGQATIGAMSPLSTRLIAGRDPADDGPLDVTTVDRIETVSGPGMRLVMRNGATR